MPQELFEAGSVHRLELPDGVEDEDERASFILVAWALASLSEGIVVDRQAGVIADAESFWELLTEGLERLRVQVLQVQLLIRKATSHHSSEAVGLFGSQNLSRIQPGKEEIQVVHQRLDGAGQCSNGAFHALQQDGAHNANEIGVALL